MEVNQYQAIKHYLSIFKYSKRIKTAEEKAK